MSYESAKACAVLVEDTAKEANNNNKKASASASIGKKNALKRYDQFALNTSCFWGSTESNITPVVQFHEIFVTKILNILLLNQKFGEIAHL